MHLRSSAAALAILSSLAVTACGDNTEPTSPSVVGGSASLNGHASTPAPPAAAVAADTIAAGLTYQLVSSAVSDDAVSQGRSFESTNPAIVSVDEGGKLVGHHGGSSNVVSRNSEADHQFSVTVVGPSTEAGRSSVRFEVFVTPAELAVGAEAEAWARYPSSNGASPQRVSWTTSDPSMAAFQENGSVRGLKAGTTWVIGSIHGARDSVQVTITGSTTESPPPTDTASTPVDSTTTPPTTPSGSPSPAPNGLIVAAPELPRKTVNTSYPQRTGRSISVPAGGDLQAAIYAAQPGDEILLEPGATYTGDFDLPTRSCSDWVVIRTAGDTDFPAPGTRITPAYAGRLAKVVSNTPAPAFLAKNGSCKWWISRVEITSTQSWVNYNYGLVRFGEDETSLSAMPVDLVLDRVYVHGGVGMSTQHAVILNSDRAAVIDSYIADIHWPWLETHAIAGWAGPGPYKIENNFIEAASINLIFGGADPRISGLTPSDIEIRRNYFYKPTSYRGASYAVKNLLEFKHVKRVLLEGNIFENSWADGQIGFALMLQSLTDCPSCAPWTATSDITMRYNIVRNANGGVSLSAHGWNGSGIAMTRVAVEHNLFENIGGDQLSEGVRLLNDLSDIRVAHNTIVRNTETMGAPFMLDRERAGATRVALLDNVAGSAKPYGAVFLNGGAQGSNAMQDYTGGSWALSGNVLWSLESFLFGVYPSDNFYPSTQSLIGFVTDWSLGMGSPYRGKATDGTDPGVNFSQLRSLTAGVERR